VLLLDLAQLGRDLPDLVLVVLHGSRVVGRLQQGVLLHELARAVIQPIIHEKKAG
jgi:hypothetical protein